MLKQQIERLFSAYLAAFNKANIGAMRNCYALPCTLSTPDELKLIDNDSGFEQAFIDIFQQLQSAQVTKIKASKASFTELNNSLVSAVVDWQFYNNNQQLFTEFTALYQIAKIDGCWAIINVVSHDIGQSVKLSNSFIIG